MTGIPRTDLPHLGTRDGDDQPDEQPSRQQRDQDAASHLGTRGFGGVPGQPDAATGSATADHGRDRTAQTEDRNDPTGHDEDPRPPWNLTRTRWSLRNLPRATPILVVIAVPVSVAIPVAIPVIAVIAVFTATARAILRARVGEVVTVIGWVGSGIQR